MIDHPMAGSGIPPGVSVRRRGGVAVAAPNASVSMRGPLGCKLTEWRLRAGIRTRDLEQRLKFRGTPITFTRLSGFQNGELVPTIHEVRALCAVLECRPTDLWPVPTIQPLGFIDGMTRRPKTA